MRTAGGCFGLSQEAERAPRNGYDRVRDWSVVGASSAGAALSLLAIDVHEGWSFQNVALGVSGLALAAIAGVTLYYDILEKG